MAAIVPPRLMNLSGLPADGSEPHIQPGNHLRVAHHPLLGLPVAPFIVQRASLGSRQISDFAPRRDIVFRDAADRILTLPITVEKGDEIRATIVHGPALSCIFVSMATAPIGKPAGREPVVPPRLIANTRLSPASIARLSRVVPTIDTIATRADWLSPIRDAAGTSAVAAPKAGDLRMRVYESSIGQGKALIGERRAAPYAMGGTAICEIAITGRGVITDMGWLAAQDLTGLKWVTVDVLNLPHKEGLRYLSVTDARDRAEQRVRRQAPKRRPLQETTGAVAPASAPAFTDTEERQRVSALATPLDGDLDQLIDGAGPPLTATETIPVTDAGGRPLAPATGDESSIEVSHLGRVLQSTLDPGVAAWLGYKALDDRKGLTEPLAFYRVVGFFRHPAAIGAKADALRDLPLGAIPLADRQMDAQAVFREVEYLSRPILSAEGRATLGKLEDAGDYMMMAAVTAVNSLAAPDAPRAPFLLTPKHLAWLPGVPPAAVREVECPVKDVLVGATLAAEHEQPVPGGHASLNRVAGSGPWHTPLTLGLTTANDGELLSQNDGRQGVIFDRRVAAGEARYHLAQQDRFGRWSSFATALAAPGPRPRPPRPVVQGHYTPPAIADAAAEGGTFLLRVPLPEPESLAPGSHLLKHVRLSLRHHNTGDPTVELVMPDITVSASTTINIDDNPPAGQAPRRAVPVTVTGPILQPTEQRRMVITAVWVDTANQESEPSTPLRLAMNDPRPPAQMTIPDVLLYSSRPDATGLAWIERSWIIPPGTTGHYAAYYTDEVRLLSWLEAEGRAAEADDIAATADRAARAGKLRAIQAQFPDHLFERLAGAVDTSTPGKGHMRHAVSGSTRVLNAYKIVVEAKATGARPTLSGLDMVFYAVPNSDPPPRPSISVKPVAPLAGEPPMMVEVTVTVEPGVTRALQARIYRTRGGPADPLHAPLIGTVTLSAPDPVTGRQTATLRDTGSAIIAPTATLSAFARYQWLAEVQGAPESGSSVPGLWSRPSDPTGLVTIPLDAPSAPVLDAIEGTAVVGGTQDLRLRLSHPLGLQPTPVGPWKVEVLRAEPGQDWARMVVADIAEAPAIIADPTPGGFTPLSTQYRITLFDPTGRPTPPLDVTTS